MESPGNRSQDKDLVIEEVTPGSADGGGDMRQEGKEPCRRHQQLTPWAPGDLRKTASSRHLTVVLPQESGT